MIIKAGDDVQVIAGKHKGDTGRVERVLLNKGSVIVKGLNIVKKHSKGKEKGEKGVILELSKPIHASSVALVDPESKKPTRVKYQMVDNRKVRMSVRSGKEI